MTTHKSKGQKSAENVSGEGEVESAIAVTKSIVLHTASVISVSSSNESSSSAKIVTSYTWTYKKKKKTHNPIKFVVIN